MPGIPGPRAWWQLFASTSLYDIVLAPFAVVTLGVGWYKFFYDRQPVRAWLTGTSAVVVFVIGSVKALVAHRQQSATRSTHELEGCLHALHAVLVGTVPAGAASPGLRIAIHKAIENGARLQQVLSYVGDKRGAGGVGRMFPVQSGIVGRAFRLQQPLRARRKSDDYEQYIQELVTDWAYTEADARKLNRESKGWLALPLRMKVDGADVVQGIIFCDSTDRDFFFNDARVELLRHGSRGIARFLSKRYG